MEDSVKFMATLGQSNRELGKWDTKAAVRGNIKRVF